MSHARLESDPSAATSQAAGKSTPYPEIPRHVAIIMDGNGRWAKERGLPRLEGHRTGAESVREVMEACIEIGVEYLTLYAFSSENWNRPPTEVKALMSLLDRFLKEKAKDLDRQNVRLLAIGQIERLPEKTRALLDKIQKRTANHTALTLVLALSYGGREEIVAAAKSLATDAASGTPIPTSSLGHRVKCVFLTFCSGRSVIQKLSSSKNSGRTSVGPTYSRPSRNTNAATAASEPSEK
jgi:undecaprenyl diphosphate synthase